MPKVSYLLFQKLFCYSCKTQEVDVVEKKSKEGFCYSCMKVEGIEAKNTWKLDNFVSQKIFELDDFERDIEALQKEIQLRDKNAQDKGFFFHLNAAIASTNVFFSARDQMGIESFKSLINESKKFISQAKHDGHPKRLAMAVEQLEENVKILKS